MNFQSDKYTIIRRAISPELAKFASDYFLLKREVFKTMKKTGFLRPQDESFGMWGDAQVPDTYAHYGDIVMETLLKWVQPEMEKRTGLSLTPTYSYARIYKKGDTLHRHKDRPSCEISTTLNLGGDHWSIYLEPEIEVNLTHGDMLIYSGCILEHWREVFEGDTCVQVFLHYNSTTENEFDKRRHLGLPSAFANT
jgi:hypothetical protein